MTQFFRDVLVVSVLIGLLRLKVEGWGFASLYVYSRMPLGHGNRKIRKGNVIGAEEGFHHLVYNLVPHIVFKCRRWSDRQLCDVWRLNKLSMQRNAAKHSQSGD